MTKGKKEKKRRPPSSPSRPPLTDDRLTVTEVADLLAELEEWRRRAEVAEAIAAERADALADARASLALAQRLAALTIAENVTPIPQAIEQTTGEQGRRAKARTVSRSSRP